MPAENAAAAAFPAVAFIWVEAGSPDATGAAAPMEVGMVCVGIGVGAAGIDLGATSGLSITCGALSREDANVGVLFCRKEVGASSAAGLVARVVFAFGANLGSVVVGAARSGAEDVGTVGFAPGLEAKLAPDVLEALGRTAVGEATLFGTDPAFGETCLPERSTGPLAASSMIDPADFDLGMALLTRDLASVFGAAVRAGGRAPGLVGAVRALPALLAEVVGMLPEPVPSPPRPPPEARPPGPPGDFDFAWGCIRLPKLALGRLVTS